MNQMQLTLSLDRAQEIIDAVKFPSLPSLISDIFTYVESPEASLRKLAEMVSSDLALSAIVLKYANSADSSPVNQITNISHALNRIGLDQFKTVILQQTLRKEMQKCALSSRDFEIFWNHGLIVAKCAAFLAREVLKRDSAFEEKAYLTGLFHDCGIPIMAERYANYNEIAIKAFYNETPLVEMEDRMFHTDHSVVCYLVGNMWSLPRSVTQAMLYHHSGDLEYHEEGEVRDLFYLLYLSGKLTKSQSEKNVFVSTELDNALNNSAILVSLGIKESFDELTKLLIRHDILTH